MSQLNDGSIPTANSAVDKQITPSGDSACSDSDEPIKKAANERNETKDSTPGPAFPRETDQGSSEEKLSIHKEQKGSTRVALEQASMGNENPEPIMKSVGKLEQDFSSVLEHPSADRSDHEDVNKVSSLEDSDSHVVQSKTDCPKVSEVVSPNKSEDTQCPVNVERMPHPRSSPSENQIDQPEKVQSPQEVLEELSNSFAKKVNVYSKPAENSSGCPDHKTASSEEEITNKAENHENQVVINVDENGSAISDGDSVDEEFDEAIDPADYSDDDMLPGARRPRHGHSDDEDEDDDDVSGEYDEDDDDYSYHDDDKDSRYSDVEGSQLRDACSSKPLEASPVSSSPKYVNEQDSEEVTDSPISNKESELDADQDKTNPAYIPRTGRYFMHDCRKDDEVASQVNSAETRSRKEPKKWQHDRFRYREQAPRTTAELIRKYGYDIREDDKSTSKNADESLVSVDESKPMNDIPLEIKPGPEHRNSKEPHESVPRGSMKSGSGHRAPQIRHDTSTHSNVEVRSRPSRSLRGRFTVGQRRSAHPHLHRGRSDTTHFTQQSRNDTKVVAERQQPPDHTTGVTNQVNQSGQSRSSEHRNYTSKSTVGRQSQNRRGMEYRGSVQQSYPSRRPFTRSRGTPQRENLSHSGRPVTTGAQPRFSGPNPFNENVAPRVRDDHKPSEQGPKRYSALRQTTGYRPNLADSSSVCIQSEQLTQHRIKSTENQYNLNVHSVIPEETVAYNAGQKFIPVTHEYGSSNNFLMDNMSSVNRSDAQFHPNTVHYSHESSAQSYAYDDSATGDPTIYTNAAYQQMTPVDMYPITGVEHYSEAMPIHPYLYSTTVDGYQLIPAGGTAQPYESSPATRERRPLLGRRPLKPLEIKDPRDRCQSTSTGPDQTTEQKGKPAQESWSAAPTIEVTTQNT